MSCVWVGGGEGRWVGGRFGLGGLVCACMRAYVCVRARMRACMCECVCTRACMRVVMCLCGMHYKYSCVHMHTGSSRAGYR